MKLLRRIPSESVINRMETIKMTGPNLRIVSSHPGDDPDMLFIPIPDMDIVDIDPDTTAPATPTAAKIMDPIQTIQPTIPSMPLIRLPNVIPRFISHPSSNLDPYTVPILKTHDSTTQQLVDNTLLDQDKTLTRKIRQAFYAIGLYDTMNKREIFTTYTNVIYYVNGAYGLYNASLVYFGVSPSALNDGELTMLAGIPNDPHGDDPFRSFSDARERQQIVLHNMIDNGVINSSEARKIFEEPIHLITSTSKERGT